MIEDKKLGLKVAENPLEELWEKSREATERRIEGLEKALIVEKAFLEMCVKKLENPGRENLSMVG